MRLKYLIPLGTHERACYLHGPRGDHLTGSFRAKWPDTWRSDGLNGIIPLADQENSLFVLDWKALRRHK